MIALAGNALSAPLPEDTPLKGAESWSALFKQLTFTSTDSRLKQFYAAGVVSDNTPIKEIDFVAIDFETTGLNAKKDKIISIGLVPFNINRIYCRGSRYWVINPKCALRKESVVIHSITDSEIKSAPTFSEKIDEILAAIAGKVVVAHYKNIERNFLNQAMLKAIGEGITFPIVDTMDIEYAFQQQQSKGFINWIKGKKPHSVRLAKSRERYNLPNYHAHHALTDALATAELLLAQLQYHYDPQTPISDIWR